MNYQLEHKKNFISKLPLVDSVHHYCIAALMIRKMVCNYQTVSELEKKRRLSTSHQSPRFHSNIHHFKSGVSFIM